MFSDEVLQAILSNRRVIRVPIGYQSEVIRGVEEELEHMDIEIRGHDVVKREDSMQPVFEQ